MPLDFLSSSLLTSLQTPSYTSCSLVGQQFDKWQWMTQKPNIHIGMADSKPTDVHVVTKYLGLDVWHMQILKLCGLTYANIFEMFVNWSQPKTRNCF